MENCTEWEKTTDYDDVWQLQSIDGKREFHEGPLQGHFAIEIT